MRCVSCAKELEVTAYGRCPLCGSVVDGGSAKRVDARVRRRAFWRWVLDPPPDEDESGASSGCGSCLCLAVGVPALVVFVALVSVGRGAGWRSDGPGILVVMIGAAVSGMVALSALGGLVLGGTRLGRWLWWWGA